MLAGIPEFREVDFSHLTLEHTDFESAEPARIQQSTLLWYGLLLSSLLHLSLLLVEFSSDQARPQQITTHRFHIELFQAPIKKTSPAPERITKEIVKVQSDTKVTTDIVASPASQSVITSVEKPRAVQQPSRLVIEPLSAQELAAIVERHTAEPDYHHAPAIAENVFHSGLRAKLNEEASKPLLARVEDAGLVAHTDPSGATIVMLDNGGCLRSPPSEIGAEKNWYVSVTPCPGKSRSEKIMEQVEQSITGKLKFDKNQGRD